MKETIKNIKKVYKYGKEYRKDLLWLVFCCISGIIVGVIVPLLSAKQIVHITSSNWEQAIYISIVILIVGCYTYFVKCFFWSRPAHHFSKLTTKNIQMALRKRNSKNKSKRYGQKFIWSIYPKNNK